MDINIEELFMGSLSPESLAMYTREWREYCNFVAKKKMKPTDPAAFLTYKEWFIQETNLSVNTINRNLNHIRAIVSVLHKHKIISRMTLIEFRDIRNVRPSSLPHRAARKPIRITPEEMRRMIELTSVDMNDPLPNLERAVLLTLATSGLRSSELCRIQITDLVITPQGPCIENVTVKAKAKSRTIPLSQEAYDAIQDWLYVRPIQSNYVFTMCVSEFGEMLWRRTPMNNDKVKFIVKKYGAMINRPDISPHSFRRFVGTTLAKQNIRLAQKVLGHSDIMMTARHYVLDEAPIGVTEDLF